MITRLLGFSSWFVCLQLSPLRNALLSCGLSNILDSTWLLRLLCHVVNAQYSRAELFSSRLVYSMAGRGNSYKPQDDYSDSTCALGQTNPRERGALLPPRRAWPGHKRVSHSCPENYQTFTFFFCPLWITVLLCVVSKDTKVATLFSFSMKRLRPCCCHPRTRTLTISPRMPMPRVTAPSHSPQPVQQYDQGCCSKATGIFNLYSNHGKIPPLKSF